MNEVIIPIGIVGLVMTVPIIGILTRHQRNMALIIHNPQNRAVNDEAQRQMQREIAELKEIVGQQAILLDDLGNMHRRLLERSLESEALKTRLNG